MFSSRFSRLFILVTVLVLGLWAIFAVSTPATETVQRQTAVQSFAPIDTDRVSDISAETADQLASPVVVDLSQIPAGVYDPNNQYDRWQRGELDLDEVEGIRGAAEMAAMREASLKLEPNSSIQQASSSPGLQALTASTNFDSIDYTECCGGGGNVPPDPELAVGPNHVIAVVNVAFEIYNKNGNSLAGPITFASFMSGNSNCTGVFDPNANYDEEADRYILGIDADGVGYCVAVSQTGDPTGSWNLYYFDTISNRRDFFDYPHAGVGRDAIYMGANIFRGNFFNEARVWAFDKDAMYNGQPAASVSVGLGAAEDTPQPLNLHGYAQGTWPTDGPQYIFTETDYNGSTHTVFAWNDPFGANTFSTVGTVNLNAATGVNAGMPVDTPQSGGSAMQANDFRPQDFEYRNGFAWTSSTIACNPGGGTVNCVRWAQIDPATATVVDAGVYASSGQYRTFADLAVDGCDNMAVGYTKSSSSMFPSIWVTGRESGDPAGTLQAETQLKAGEITYTAFDSVPRRWGDYTEMTIDPAGTTFWYLGEYSKNTGTSSGRWGTYIGSFSYGCNPGNPGPTPTPVPPTPTPEPTATPDPSATMHVGDLDGSITPVGAKKWRLNVTITVHDSGEAPVAGATVSGNFSGGTSGSASCVTNGAGQCTVTSSNANNGNSITFTVSNVSGALTYDSGANHDPDPDSNGTTISAVNP